MKEIIQKEKTTSNQSHRVWCDSRKKNAINCESNFIHNKNYDKSVIDARRKTKWKKLK